MNGLKQLIESLVSEALSDIEEVWPIDKGRETPKGSPFGRFLWGDFERADGKKEKDNPIERELLKLLHGWMHLNELSHGIKLLNLLSRFRDHGVLDKYFVPPSGTTIYRFVKMPIEKASEQLGISVEELNRQAGDAQAHIGKGGGKTFKPAKHLSSWTVDLKAPNIFRFAQGNFGEVVMLFRSTVDSQKHFYLNPEELIAMFDDQVSHFLPKEKEIIASGPVKYDKVVYLVQGREENADEAFLSARRIHKLLSAAME